MNSYDFLKNKLGKDEYVTINAEILAELLTYIVNDIAKFDERLKVCEHMLYLDDESFKKLKGDCDE